MSEEIVKSFDPVKTARSRKNQLPKSRYVCFGLRREVGGGGGGRGGLWVSLSVFFFFSTIHTQVCGLCYCMDEAINTPSV